MLLFAALGFFYVPLGERTGYEHLERVLTTAEAKDAATELEEAAGELMDEVVPDSLPAKDVPSKPIEMPTNDPPQAKLPSDLL